jgi:hypothetical protein
MPVYKGFVVDCVWRRYHIHVNRFPDLQTEFQYPAFICIFFTHDFHRVKRLKKNKKK